MIVSRRDDGPARARLVVDPPSHAVPVGARCHQAHVLVPAADAPDGFTLVKLLANEGREFLVAILVNEDVGCRHHELDSLIHV